MEKNYVKRKELYKNSVFWQKTQELYFSSKWILTTLHYWQELFLYPPLIPGGSSHIWQRRKVVSHHIYEIYIYDLQVRLNINATTRQDKGGRHGRSQSSNKLPLLLSLPLSLCHTATTWVVGWFCLGLLQIYHFCTSGCLCYFIAGNSLENQEAAWALVSTKVTIMACSTNHQPGFQQDWYNYTNQELPEDSVQTQWLHQPPGKENPLHLCRGCKSPTFKRLLSIQSSLLQDSEP